MHLETGYPNYTNQLLANIVSGGSHSYHFGGYARNDGWNRDLFRDVMAQLYVPALETEMDLREYVRTQNYKVVTYNVSANHTWGYKQDYYDTFINRPNTVLITNIWNNPGLSNEVIKLFRGDGTYEEVDYKDSLKVKDNHQYYIFWRENIRQMVVFSNTVCDEFIFKLGAAIHVQYKTNIDDETVEKLLACDYAGYVRSLNKVVEKYMVEYQSKKKWIDMRLSLKNINEIKLTKLTRRETDLKNDISCYEETVRRFYADLLKVQREIVGAKAEKDSEFLDFLLNNCKEQITNFYESSEGVFSFAVQVPLLYWEEDDFDCMRDYIDENYEDWVSELCDDIFVARKVDLIFNQGFNFDIFDHKINCDRGAASINYGMPNPHHQAYNCWGDNYVEIVRFLKEGDYICAYLQAVSAIQGLNIADGAVWERFLDYIGYQYKDNCPCIKVKETGEIMTISDYMNLSENDDDEDEEED